MSAIERAIGRLTRAMTALAAVVVFVIMAYGAADIVAGMVFGAPLPSKLELSSALFAVTIFLAFAGVQESRGNIAVDIFYRRMGRRGQRLSDAASFALGAFVFAFLTYGCTLLARDSFAIRETAVAVWAFPVWPAKAAAAFGAAVMTLVCVLQLVRTLLGGRAAPRPEGTVNG